MDFESVDFELRRRLSGGQKLRSAFGDLQLIDRELAGLMMDAKLEALRDEVAQHGAHGVTLPGRGQLRDVGGEGGVLFGVEVEGG